MKRTDELIKSALVGTEILDVKFNDSGDFSEIVKHVENLDKESKLLTLSAFAFKYNLAGKIPLKADGLNLSVAEEEDLEMLDEKLLFIIKNLFSQYPDLLPEFLEKVIEKRMVFPEYLLPGLLNEGAKNKYLQKMILKVCGKRGLWLAKQNNSWNYLFDEQRSDDDIWNNETSGARINLLNKLRESNPEKSLELIKSTWKDESAQDKVKFLETLRKNLSLKDEEFLEFALDDKRSKEVRKKASELLSLITESALVERMCGRFDKLLEITKKKGKETLIINTIDVIDGELLRDLGGEVYDLSSLQLKESFLNFQVMAKIPLKFFTSKFGTNPDNIIEMLQGHKKLSNLLNHLSSQTLTEKNTEWAKIFIEYSGFEHLVSILDEQEKEKFILKKLSQSVEKFQSLLSSHNLQWSNDFSYQVVKIIFSDHQEKLKDKDRKSYNYSFYTLLNHAKHFYPKLSAKITEEFLHLLPSDSYEYRYFNDFINILHFRHNMLKEFEL